MFGRRRRAINDLLEKEGYRISEWIAYDRKRAYPTPKYPTRDIVFTLLKHFNFYIDNEMKIISDASDDQRREK